MNFHVITATTGSRSDVDLALTLFHLLTPGPSLKAPLERFLIFQGHVVIPQEMTPLVEFLPVFLQGLNDQVSSFKNRSEVILGFLPLKSKTDVFFCKFFTTAQHSLIIQMLGVFVWGCVLFFVLFFCLSLNFL